MSDMGEPEALWDALLVANPIAVTDELTNASLRQRNAYFSSSDAAFRDRYQASAEWERVRSGKIAADGGWRIYSSGPGLIGYLLIQHVFGIRRRFGERMRRALPAGLAARPDRERPAAQEIGRGASIARRPARDRPPAPPLRPRRTA